MPIIDKFDGITIKMYFLQSEHNPPHIHAIYGKTAVAIEIKTGKILDGVFPLPQLERVNKWVDAHREELLAMWEMQAFHKI